MNGMPFTICMGTFAVVVAGCVAIGSSMLVAGGAKEAQELWPVDASMQSKVYGAKHAGMYPRNVSTCRVSLLILAEIVSDLPYDLGRCCPLIAGLWAESCRSVYKMSMRLCG